MNTENFFLLDTTIIVSPIVGCCQNTLRSFTLVSKFDCSYLVFLDMPFLCFLKFFQIFKVCKPH